MCHVCKSSQKWGQGPKPKRDIFARTKTTIFFTETKTKTRHICRDQNHILALNKKKSANKIKDKINNVMKNK